ncbi:hypothetical protein P3G55_26450, partial [Leptospira sp. 96542]|nr:hypothetical protein [Leptospira sp. 96542]
VPVNELRVFFNFQTRVGNARERGTVPRWMRGADMSGAEGQNAQAHEHTASAMASWAEWMHKATQAQQAQAAAFAAALVQGVPQELRSWLPWLAATAPESAIAPSSVPGLPATAFPAHELPRIPSDTLQALQQQYLNDCAELAREGWKDDTARAFHALNARLLTQMAEAVQADAKTRARIRFGVDQWG